MLLTGIQETQEQSSTSTQREALSSVTNRFELQEVLQNNVWHIVLDGFFVKFSD